MDVSDRYPELFQVLAGGFHQDWMDLFEERGESPDEEVVLREMLTQMHPHELKAAMVEIADLLIKYPDEDGLRNVVRRDLGANVDPRLDGSSMRQWIIHVSDLMKAKVSVASN